MSVWGKTIIVLLLFVALPVVAEECESVEECEALLQEYEARIKEYQGNIDISKAEQRTLNNKIYELRQRIDQLDYKIKKSNIVIGDLQDQMTDTQQSIQHTENKISESKENLSVLLRRVYEEDQKSSLEVFLGDGSLSGFFENIFSLERLLNKSKDILVEIEEMKVNLEEKRVELGVEEGEWKEWKEVQILQKQQSQGIKNEQEYLLQETKGEEERYQELLAENRKKAQAIRERLFSLIGVPDAPTFGEALELARYVEDVTGVRAPLVLAILTQESNIGSNVGQCYLKDFETGAGVVVSTGQAKSKVMKPSRDVNPFLETTRGVGRNPKNTLVSCPMSFGWGGAMGPAQFIPSTWVLYDDKVSDVTGSPADPWNIRDAFLASGFLLKDAGAGARTHDSEWCAAMVYFSGSCYSGYNFYGDSVMSLVAKYEDDIEQLDTYGSQ